MLYSQSGLDQILTVEMPVLCCVSDAYPVSGLDSLVLASERNVIAVISALSFGLDSLVLAIVKSAFVSGTPDTP
jgi:hypothetical protein